MSAPLEGIRVLDLSRLLPGPACTWALRGLGATVDRVEPPGRGDYARHLPPFVHGVGVYFAATSIGKRSLALALRHPSAAGVLRRLLTHYDVLVEGFRPGVLEAMGLEPAGLVATYPGLVVARLSGYGQTGPWSQRPGHDINYVGMTGLLAGVGQASAGPVLPPTQIADLSGALVAAMGIAAALFERERARARGAEGGRVLDISLTEAALATAAPTILAATAARRDPTPGGEPLTGGLPVYRCYRCADGRWLTIGALEPKFHAALLAAGLPLDEGGLAETIATAPRDHWESLLAGACVGPVLAPTEVAGHPLHRQRGAVTEVDGATWVRPPLGQPGSATGPLPGIGEHSHVILTEAGFEQSEIEALVASGAVT